MMFLVSVKRQCPLHLLNISADDVAIPYHHHHIITMQDVCRNEYGVDSDLCLHTRSHYATRIVQKHYY